MSTSKDFKYIVQKKKVYVARIGPIHLWNTAAATKEECVEKALKHFNLKTERSLKYKGADIIQLFVKEIKTQENNSNKSV